MIDTLGDRCKEMEMIWAGQRLLPGIPILARLDGRAFHTYTRDMERPFDSSMSNSMISATAALVEEFKPLVGYTQSDEITLVWLFPEVASDLPFGGRVQKLTSVLASFCTAAFVERARRMRWWDDERLPSFDCRVWQVPTIQEALNAVIWRQDDAEKNSVSMAARAQFSHKQLHGKSAREMRRMLDEKGIIWGDYPPFFKRGTFVRRVVRERTLTEAERMRIRAPYRPPADQKFTRSIVRVVDMPRVRKLANPIEAVFYGEPPRELVSQETPNAEPGKEVCTD